MFKAINYFMLALVYARILPMHINIAIAVSACLAIALCELLHCRSVRVFRIRWRSRHRLRMEGMAKAYERMGLAMRSRGEFQRAREMLSKAREIHVRLGARQRADQIQMWLDGLAF